MSRIGQFLQTRGVITSEQLDDALGHQAVQGARLGTNLVELGYLSAETLAECLSAYHKVPLPPRKWLEKPQRAAAQRVTRALVERIRFIPLRLDGKVLHVALLDPRHPNVLDDVRFATGCRIEPYVLPEIWMHDWLFELFHVPRGIRQVQSRAAPSTPSPRVSAEINADRPDAPPQFETTAMANTHAANAAAAASARRRAVSAPVTDPRPVMRKRRESAPPPAVTSPEAAAPAAPAPRAPAPETPIAQARESLRPPAVRLVGAAPLSQIGETSWALRAPPTLVQPVEDSSAQPLQSESFALPDTQDLPATAADLSPSFGPPSLPDLQPAAEPTAEPPVLALEPMAVARELSHWESSLLQAVDRERLIELAFAIAGCFATRVALFTVHQGMVQGLRYLDRGLARPIDGVLLPLDSACMLTEVVARGESMRADPRLCDTDRMVTKVVCDEHAHEVALFPVAIKQRVVNVLYASNAHEPLGPVAFGALRLVAQEMGVAYGRLILARKVGAGAGLANNQDAIPQGKGS